MPLLLRPCHYKLFTLLYLLLLSALYLLPASFFPAVQIWGIDAVVHFTSYALLGWLALSALGSCPLRWRSLALWVLVIAISHAYWMEFLQGFLPSLSRYPSYIDWAWSTAGAFTGVIVRIKVAWKRCNCSHTAGTFRDYTGSGLLPFTGRENVQATIAHHPSLPGIIASVFGWKTLNIGQRGQWRLSLVCTGRSLVSLPHFSYGALHVAPGFSEPQRQVGEHLGKMHFEKGFSGLEFRHLHNNNSYPRSFKVVSWLGLKDDYQQQRQSFSSNLRSKINRGYRNGMKVISGGEELLDDFHSVYARHIHHLGSAPLPKKFFRHLLKHYNTHGGTAAIFVVNQGTNRVGAAFTLAYEGFYENGWFATQKSVQKLYASYVLHEAMLMHAIALGSHTYSFGRSSDGSGVHRFKQQWHTYDVYLDWVQFPKPTIELRKHIWLLNLWSRIPYPLSNLPSRWLAKWIY